MKKIIYWYNSKSLSMKLVLIFTSVFILFICFYLSYFFSLLTPQVSSTELHGKYYSEVVKHFKDLGFENIEVDAIKDLEFGNEKSKIVESISIGGDKKFDTYSRFSSSEEVIITYHDFSKQAIKYVPLTSMNSIEEVEIHFKKLGFENIIFQKAELTSGDAKELNQYEIKIDNSTPEPYFYYSKKSSVQVYYSVLSKDAIQIKNFEISDNLSPEKVVEELKKLGLTNVKINKVKTSDTSLHNKYSGIRIQDNLHKNSINDVIVKKNSESILIIYDASEQIAEDERRAAEENKRLEKEQRLASATREEKNALQKAKDYIKYTAFSKEGLYEQLQYEKYPDSAARFAVENIEVDWNEQALKKAKQYLDYTSFSNEGLREQLLYERFTPEQAQYALDHLD